MARFYGTVQGARGEATRRIYAPHNPSLWVDVQVLTNVAIGNHGRYTMAWPKRRRQWNSLQANSTVLGSHFHSAQKKIEELTIRVVDATTDFEALPREVIGWLFKADDIAKCQAAYGLTSGNDRFQSYELADKVELTVDYDAVGKMLSLADTALSVDREEAAPLFKAIQLMQETHRKFSGVLQVMRWLDEHATPGAVRHYWPTMRTLAPDATCFGNGPPVRFTEPQDIAPMLPLIRETQGIVAGALMLPDKKRTTRGMTLSLSGNSFTHDSGVKVDSQSIVFYL